MKKHEHHTQGSFVQLLDGRGQFNPCQVWFQEEEMVNQELVGNVPAFLFGEQHQVWQEVTMGDKLEPGKSKSRHRQRLANVEGSPKHAQNAKSDVFKGWIGFVDIHNQIHQQSKPGSLVPSCTARLLLEMPHHGAHDRSENFVQNSETLGSHKFGRASTVHVTEQNDQQARIHVNKTMVQILGTISASGCPRLENSVNDDKGGQTQEPFSMFFDLAYTNLL
mmetsp:Transcript_1158/g.2487  ORF Transcript_1158/g.2487 Transcript_1158/m.2487 type:complete len:221 (-) Transcript_1158:4222-4884(-)